MKVARATWNNSVSEGDRGHVSDLEHASADIDSFHPDAAVICLGGNSIYGSGPPDLVMVAIDIHRQVARLVQSGVRSVAVCQVVRRLKWRNANFEVGAAMVDQLNSYLKAFSEDTPIIFF